MLPSTDKERARACFTCFRPIKKNSCTYGMCQMHCPGAPCSLHYLKLCTLCHKTPVNPNCEGMRCNGCTCKVHAGKEETIESRANSPVCKPKRDAHSISVCSICENPSNISCTKKRCDACSCWVTTCEVHYPDFKFTKCGYLLSCKNLTNPKCPNVKCDECAEQIYDCCDVHRIPEMLICCKCKYRRINYHCPFWHCDKCAIECTGKYCKVHNIVVCRNIRCVNPSNPACVKGHCDRCTCWKIACKVHYSILNKLKCKCGASVTDLRCPHSQCKKCICKTEHCIVHNPDWFKPRRSNRFVKDTLKREISDKSTRKVESVPKCMHADGSELTVILEKSKRQSDEADEELQCVIRESLRETIEQELEQVRADMINSAFERTINKPRNDTSWILSDEDEEHDFEDLN